MYCPFYDKLNDTSSLQLICCFLIFFVEAITSVSMYLRLKYVNNLDAWKVRIMLLKLSNNGHGKSKAILSFA